MRVFAIWCSDLTKRNASRFIMDTIANDKITAARIATNKGYAFEREDYEEWFISAFKLERTS